MPGPAESPIRARDRGLSRIRPIDPARTALLVVDIQNATFNDAHKKVRPEFFAVARDIVIPNLQRLVDACRRESVEVIYTVMENLTRDGRDRSLDYKITGFNVPPGSWDGEVIDAICPGEDEMVIPKTSSNVFVSTNIDYVLRNLGTKYLVISGIVTDQCVEGAVRDACDLGYLVTLVTDACATYSAERHAGSLAAIKGYCRQRTTDEFLAEISRG